MTHNIYLYIFVMAAVTYLIRMLPLALSKKEITNQYITASLSSALAGLITAIIAAYRGKSLLIVALAACVAVFLVERIL